MIWLSLIASDVVMTFMLTRRFVLSVTSNIADNAEMIIPFYFVVLFVIDKDKQNLSTMITWLFLWQLQAPSSELAFRRTDVLEALMRNIHEETA